MMHDLFQEYGSLLIGLWFRYGGFRSILMAHPPR